jgi:SAM-dependent methyltransferase
MDNLVDGMTAKWLDEAGIEPGMRVLDIGCGPGTVTAQLARKVGERGKVYAVDREPRALELARERCRDLGLDNVEFIRGTFELPVPHEGPVDAAVGRRVLMYQPDPTTAVRQLARVVRPGGLVWFHEHDTTIVPHDACLPLHDRVRGWLDAMLRNEGASLRMGHELFGVLRGAGLEVEHVRAEANVLTPTTRYPIGQIIRAVLPRITATGIATEAEVGVDTLDERLVDERCETGATLVWELVFCAWGRTARAQSLTP